MHSWARLHKLFPYLQSAVKAWTLQVTFIHAEAVPNYLCPYLILQSPVSRGSVHFWKTFDIPLHQHALLWLFYSMADDNYA